MNEATWLGLTPADTAELAGIITAATFATRPARELAGQVAELRGRLPRATCAPDEHQLARQIIAAIFPETRPDTAARTP